MLTARGLFPEMETRILDSRRNLNFLVLGIMFALGKTLRTAWKKSKDLLDIKNSEQCFNDLSVNESLAHMD